MKKHILTLLFISIITIAFPANSQSLSLEELDKRITVLEMERPENAWIIKALEDLFKMASSDYAKKIESNKQYLTEEGFHSYQKILSELNIPQSLIDNQSVIRCSMKQPPKMQSMQTISHDIAGKFKTKTYEVQATLTHAMLTPVPIAKTLKTDVLFLVQVGYPNGADKQIYEIRKIELKLDE